MKNQEQLYDKDEELSFTGNWYFDISIIGFIKTIEFSLKLTFNEIIELSKKDEKRLYFLYFPFAYALYSYYKRVKLDPKKENVDFNLKDLFNKIDYLRFNIKNESDEVDERALFEKSWNNYVIPLVKEFQIYEIIDIWKGNGNNQKNIDDSKDNIAKVARELLIKLKEIKQYSSEEEILSKLNDIDSLKQIKSELRNIYDVHSVKIPDPSGGFLKNFMFLNYSCKDIKERFYATIRGDYNSFEILSLIDMTVNKFLVSTNEFYSVLYTKMRSDEFFKIKKYLFVYLICFTHAFFKNRSFEKNKIKNMFFYFYDIKKAYEINNYLDLENVEGDNSKIKRVIDELFDKSMKYFSKSIYIISYEGINKNQEIEGLEFFEISPIKATIIKGVIDVMNSSGKKKEYSNYFSEEELIDYLKGKLLFLELIKKLEQEDILKLKKNNAENKNFKLIRNLFFRYQALLLLDLYTIKRVHSKKLFDDVYFITNKISTLKDYETLSRDLWIHLAEITSFYSTFKSFFRQKGYNLEEMDHLIRHLIFCIKYNLLNDYMLSIEKIILKIYDEDYQKNEKQKETINKLLDFIKNDQCWQIYALIMVFSIIDALIGGEKVESV